MLNELKKKNEETVDMYLTRAAKAMDSIMNGVEFMNGRCLKDEMTLQDVQDFKDYVGKIIMPIILEAVSYCRAAGMINGIEEDFQQNLAEIIFRKFPEYNNSKTKDYSELYCFSTFVKLYMKDAIRRTRGQEKGYGSRLDRKRRMISKAKIKAAEILQIKEEDITDEDLFKYMPLVTKNPLSVDEIKRTRAELQSIFSTGVLGQGEEAAQEDKIYMKEDNISADFRKLLDQLRPMQQYIFLQNIGFCSDKYDDIHSKQLACDPTFVLLCSNDMVGAGHIMHGNFRIDRIKIGNRYFEAVDYEDIDYLEPRFIRDERARINKKFRKLVAEKDYIENEVVVNLIPLLIELKVEMKRKYNL